MEDLHKTITLSQRDRQARHSLLKAHAKKLKFKQFVSSKSEVAADTALPPSSWYILLWPVGPGILLIWGNVGPHFVTIFWFNTSHINTCFVTFIVFRTMQLTIQGSGMNKFKVYVNSAYYHHFMVSMIKIDMLWSTFDILIHVYNCLQVIWSFRKDKK